MTAPRLRDLLVPAFLFLCILLGGSAQGVIGNLALQLLAILLMAWAALAPAADFSRRAARPLIGLLIIALLLLLVQLVPLPPSVWAALPGREPIVSGYELLGVDPPWLPISLTPYETLGAFLALLPPVAVFLAIARAKAYRERALAAALVAGAFAGVLLGAMQLAGGGSGSSAWYLYPITNTGAVGFFANSNHMASLLVVSIPFAFALVAAGQPSASMQGRGFATFAAGAGGLLIILLGLVLNGSLAAIALSVPVLAASALVLPAGWRFRRLAVAAMAVAPLASLVALTSSPIHVELSQRSESAAVETRRAIWTTSSEIAANSLPLGTGVGSFQRVYALQEDPREVDLTYVNHAHNDYLQLVVEMGLGGALLILLFLAWWLVQLVRIWRSPHSTHFVRAATIGSAAILAHSFVDFPLRTAAMAAVFAMCVGLMAQWRRYTQSTAEAEFRPAKHLTIG